jgi:hypothetical protein
MLVVDGSICSSSHSQGQQGQRIIHHDCDCSWMVFILSQIKLFEQGTCLDNVTSSSIFSVGSPVMRKRKAESTSVAKMTEGIVNDDIDKESVLMLGKMDSAVDFKMSEKELKKFLLDGNIVDGRVTLKKFCNIAFVNCCAGHYHLLQGLVHILNDSLKDVRRGSMSVSDVDDDLYSIDENDKTEFVSWRKIITPSETEWTMTQDFIASSHSTLLTARPDDARKLENNKMNKSAALATHATTTLALSALSTRIVDLVHESGKSCGIFPSKNGIHQFITKYYDPYVGIVHPIDKKLNSEVTSSGRPSIYNITVEVLRLMMMNHGCCLNEIAASIKNSRYNESRVFMSNFPFSIVAGSHVDESSLPTGYIMLNEGEEMNCDWISEYGYYHPSLHNTIDSLIRCANFSSPTNDKNAYKILCSLAAAFALKNSIATHNYNMSKPKMKYDMMDCDILNIDNVVVVDAKLCSYSLHQLSDILRNITSITRNNSGISSYRECNINSEIIRHFSLNVPIVPKQELMYAGIITADATVAATNKSDHAINGYLLSLFFRVMLPADEKISRSNVIRTPDMLMSMVMHVIEACYTLKKPSSDYGRDQTNR